MRPEYSFTGGVRGKYAGRIKIPLPDVDYACGAAFCDDPACNEHGPKDADGRLLYWTPEKLERKAAEKDDGD